MSYAIAQSPHVSSPASSPTAGQAAVHAAAHAHVPDTSPVYFLLVDDLEENLVSLEALLRRDGLVLLKARSGRQALEMLLAHDVALAFLDVQMPEMDGFELAELMRGTERTRRVPIIFLTAGETDRQRRFRGYEAGAVDFLQKPIETDILRSKAEVFFELHRQQQQLEHQRDELRALAETLKENDSRKDDFLATLAHELRNPLAPIRNGLQVLRMAPATDVAETVRDMMDRQLTHLVRLIDDLLDVSRVNRGKIDLRREDITLQTIIEAGVESSRPVIDGSFHKLTINLPQETLWLHADLTRLAQVVNNLLNNAAKYTPDGGEINLTATRDGEKVCVTVTDNGIGIAPELLPKVFNLFTQADHEMVKVKGGLGIGLALVKRLVDMHGGTIKATSRGANMGSTLTVRLPLIDPPTAQPADDAKDVPQKATGKSLNVLVVDDNVASAKTIGWMLELMGHTSRLLHDGDEVLAVAQAMKPDVIMLDIGLPGMNGYDVCRGLREHPEFKHTMLIAQTGWGQARDRQKASEAGFDHHLVKPVDFEAMSALLSQAGAKLT